MQRIKSYADHLGTPRAITRPSDNAKVWEWKNDDPFGANQPNEDPSAAGTAFKYNLRFPGQYIKGATLGRIYDLTLPMPYDERKAIIQLGILSRNFIQVKLEQQRILAFTTTKNKAIRDSLKTVANAKASLEEYKVLLSATRSLIESQSDFVGARLASKPGWLSRVSGNGIQQWEQEWNVKLGDMRKTWSNYNDDTSSLAAKISELESHQLSLRAKSQNKDGLIAYAVSAIFVVFVVFVWRVMRNRRLGSS